MATNLLDLVAKIKASIDKRTQDNEGLIRRGKFTPLTKAKQNLQAWGQVATQPQLRQDFGRYVAKPRAKTFIDKRAQFTPFTPQYKQSQQKAQQALQKITIPTYKAPSWKATSKIAQFNLPLAGAIKAIPTGVGTLQEQLRSYGRSSEKLSTPEGRKQYASSLKGLKGKSFVDIIQDPATEASLDILDFVPFGVVGSQVAKQSLKARKILANKGIIEKSIKAIDSYGRFGKYPQRQMDVLRQLDGITEELMPALAKSKEMKKLQSYSPERWMKVVKENLIDALDIAENPIKGVKLGGSLKSIRKGVSPVKIAEEAKQAVKGGVSPESVAQYAQKGQLPQAKLAPQIKGKLLPSEDIIAQAKKGIGESKVSEKTTKQTLSQFYTDWVNKFQPLEDVSKRIEKEKGISILPSLSPKYTVKQLLGSGGTAGLRHKKKLQPILDQVDSLGIPTGDFDVFLKAKRDIGFGEVGRTIKGSDPVKAKKIIEALGNKYDLNKMEEVSNQFYKYQDEGLTMLREAGFIDEVGYNAIKKGNRYYVPFERVMDTVDDYLGMPTKKAQQATQPIQKIKGSERQIISPIESVIANTYKIEAAVAKNRVASSLVNLRNVAPEYADLFKKVKVKMAPVAKVDGETIFRPAIRNLKQSEIMVWENGKRNIYDVGDEIARSVKGLNEESMGTLTKILSAPARLLRQGATGRNIDFMIPNVFKDQLDAAVTSKYGYKPFLDYFRGLGHLMNWRRTGSDELVEQYLKSGGSIFFENMSGRKAIREQITEATTKPGVIKKLGNWAIGGIETIGEYSETPTRLGLFKRGLEKTSNPLLAAYEAREGTLDFARMGAKMKTANAIIPFLNVGVQGFDKLVRNVRSRPGKVALNMAIYGALPATMTALYNNLFHPEELLAIPDWEKETNFILITGRSEDGKPEYLKFPKGNVIPYITNPMEHFIAWAAGNDQQGFMDMALNVFSEGLPVLRGGGTPKEIASRTVGGLLPQAFKPGVEDIANFSFFKGKDIVPGYLEKKPAHEQTFKYTPEAYKALGKITGVSPLRAKNFLEGYLSGYIKVPVNLVEVLKDISDGEEPDRNQIPVLRRFISKGYDTVEDAIEKKIKITKEKTSRIPASAAETVSIALPTTTKDLAVLYKNAQGTMDRYGEKRLKIQHGLIGTKVEDVQADVDQAIALKKRIEKEHPEKVFEIQIDTYKSGGGANVEERSNWVASQLEGKSKEEAQELINKFWDGKVITKGASGVASYLEEKLGINVWGHTSKTSAKSSGRTKKMKGVTIKKARRLSVKSVKIGKSKLPAIKLTSPPTLKVGKEKTPSITIPEYKARKIKVKKLPKMRVASKGFLM